MSLSRRKMLALIGGGTILAAAGTGAAFVSTRTPTRALAPWDQAGGYGEVRKDALSWALLAPNPHNLQPWLAELRGPDEVLIWRDPARDLPHTDPFARQLTIGMGCFLEMMRMAAAQMGYAVDLQTFPEGPDGPTALARFRQGGATADPLFAHALERRSTKEPFTDQPVSAAQAAQLDGDIILDPNQVAALRTLTWEAWKVEYETPRTFKESLDVMRFGKREIEANPDGIDLGGPFLESMMVAGILTRAKQADPTSMSTRQGVEIYREMLMSTPAYAAQTSATNTPEDWLEAGRKWLRLNLQVTSLGLCLHPVSQCLQEYPEMEGHYAQAHAMLAAPGETVQMLGRLGYGPQTPRTPRWSLDAKLVNGSD